MNGAQRSFGGRVRATPAAVMLARLAGRLTADEMDDPLTLALRLGIDQLFRRDSPSRRASLILAADALGVLRECRTLEPADHELLDVVQAACLMRADDFERATLLVGELRARALTKELSDVLRDLASEQGSERGEPRESCEEPSFTRAATELGPSVSSKHALAIV